MKKRKNQCKILQNLYQFYEELFSKKVFNSNKVVANYQPSKTKEKSEQCEGEITKNEVKDALGTTQHSETMVLPVNFTELFGLNSNLLWYYLIEDSSLEN